MTFLIVFSVGALDRERKVMSVAETPMVLLFFWIGISIIYLDYETKLLKPELIADNTIQVVIYDDEVVNITKIFGRIVKEGEMVEMRTYNLSLWISWLEKPVFYIAEGK